MYIPFENFKEDQTKIIPGLFLNRNNVYIYSMVNICVKFSIKYASCLDNKTLCIQ